MTSTRTTLAFLRRGRGLKTLAGILLLSLVLLPTLASAAPVSGTYVGIGPKATVNGTVNGNNFSNPGGTMKFDPGTLGGDDLLPTFCTDINNHVHDNDAYQNSGRLSNPRLVYLVQAYPPRLAGATWPDDSPHALEDINKEMAARQAAVWHFSDGFLPSNDSGDDVAVRAWEIIDAVDALQLEEYADYEEIALPHLALTPVNAVNPLGATFYQDYQVEVLQGQEPVVGKEVRITVDTGTLDDLNGITSTLAITVATNENGQAFFGLWSPEAQGHNATVTSSLIATAEGMTFPEGAVYINQTHVPGQKLILGETTVQDLQAEATATWTKGSLTIHKFDDTNMDGEQDPSEENLPNWTFTLQAPDGSSVQLVTDVNGNVVTPLEMTGTYTVTEALKDGWQNITPISQTVTVADIDGTYLLNFANVRKPVVILGKCEDVNGDGECNYTDANENGRYDPDEDGEPRLNGWWLQLLDAGGATRPGYGGDTGSGLNPDGVWIVENDGSDQYLVAGEDYSVIEHMQPGWVSSRDPMTITIDSLPAGISDYWMPNIKAASVEVCKFIDGNGNGEYDPDFGLDRMEGGWVFELTQDGWTSPITATTSTEEDDLGCAVFDNLRPGTYTVSEVQQSGYKLTTPEANALTVTVASGEHETFADSGVELLFGNKPITTSVTLRGFSARSDATLWFSSLGVIFAAAVAVVIRRED